MMHIQYRRPDGTFITLVNGLPYHIVDGDPLFEEAQIDGLSAPLEPQAAAPALAEIKAAAQANVVSKQEAFGDILASDVSTYERASWPSKEIAARAQLTSTASASELALLTAETNARGNGETVTDLANLIVTNADAFNLIIGSMSGFRRTAYASIEAATDAAGVQSALDVMDASLAAVLAAL